MNEHLRYVTARLANLATSLETEARVAPELRSVGHESDLTVLSQRLKDALGALQMASNTAQLEILQATEVKLDLFQSQIEITTYTDSRQSDTLVRRSACVDPRMLRRILSKKAPRKAKIITHFRPVRSTPEYFLHQMVTHCRTNDAGDQGAGSAVCAGNSYEIEKLLPWICSKVRISIQRMHFHSPEHGRTLEHTTKAAAPVK